MKQNKPILLSGIQPSGNLTLGNYIGAMHQWKQFKNDFLSLFFVVDLHAMTSGMDPKNVYKSTLDTFALYLAVGMNPKQDIIFLQSHVPAHCELNWYLNSFCYFGELQRMTQFKEKSTKKQIGVNTGLFNYPCLMAADILLYQTQAVPVGADQIQHLELTRTLAARFNLFAQETIFTIPKQILPKTGARIMSLTDPTKKMSKSDSDPKSRIEILEDPDIIFKKIKEAKTDSLNRIHYDRKVQPGISNLIEIYAALTTQSTESVEKELGTLNYAQLKQCVSECVCDTLAPIQKRFQYFRNDCGQLEKWMHLGKQQATLLAEPTLHKVRGALGLISI